MSSLHFDPAAPKEPTNLSVNSDLLRIARQLGLNLSRELEQHLVRVMAEKRGAEWLDGNRKAIDECNRSVERAGAFSDGQRRF